MFDHGHAGLVKIMVAQFELRSFVVEIVELGEWFRLVLCRIVADEVMNIH